MYEASSEQLMPGERERERRKGNYTREEEEAIRGERGGWMGEEVR